jgi:DNA-binding LacI/PurR family transcriptional regulator
MLASTELTGTYDPSIVFEWIRERRVDGLIIAKSQRRDRRLIRRAVDAQLPTVLVAPDEAFPGVQLVRCDNRGAGVVVAITSCSLVTRGSRSRRTAALD